MLAERLDQIVGRGTGNLTDPLLAPNCGPELDLRQRENCEPVSRVAAGPIEQALRARLINVQLYQSARLQIVKRQFFLSPFPQNDRRQRFSLDVDRVKAQVLPWKP